MYRYVSLIWNPNDPLADSEARIMESRLLRGHTKWTSAFQTPGLTLYIRSDSKVPLNTLPCETGVIIGVTYSCDDAEDETPVIDFTEATVREFIRSEGRSLARRFWGHYIAFLRSTDSSAYVLRDCSGRIPCYRTTHKGVHVFFASQVDIANLALPAFSINFEYLASFIVNPNFEVRACGVHEVVEVLAGDGVAIDSNSLRQYCAWHPADYARENVVETYDDAVELLRVITMRCVRTWARSTDGIILRLSGGLDSAIVLGCLRKVSPAPRVLCVNDFGHDARDDERYFARLAATRAGIQLIERARRNGGAALETRTTAETQAPKPTVPAMFDLSDDISELGQIIRSFRAQSLWTGQGGDHLFFEMKTCLSFRDYLTLKGFRPAALRALHDAAVFGREPYWQVLLKCAGGEQTHQGFSDVIPPSPIVFVNPDALPKSLAAFTAHPWAEDSSDLPKGKRYQIALLSELVNRHRPYWWSGLPEEHAPLVSQPLLEVSMRIPTFLLIQGGCSRAAARTAFKDYVPQEILDRNDKGDTTFFVTDTIRRNGRAIQELLLDGILANKHIISRQELAPYLEDNQSLRLEHCWPLMASIAAELWARSWSAANMRLAA